MCKGMVKGVPLDIHLFQDSGSTVFAHTRSATMQQAYIDMYTFNQKITKWLSHTAQFPALPLGRCRP